jgi:hypothetical protein
LEIRCDKLSGKEIVKCPSCSNDAMPLPFKRELDYGMIGNDVLIAQMLVQRAPIFPSDIRFNYSVYDDFTVRVIGVYQSVYRQVEHLKITGTVDNATANSLLHTYLFDGYRPRYCRRGESKLPSQFKYMVDVPVYSNRSIETVATLYDADCIPKLHFIARTKGQMDYNELTGNGNTPTGLYTFDLQTPEDDPVSYGPYNVNRAVHGLVGNALVVAPNIRNGILLHTGEWENWNSSLPMPNSHGCIHAHPEDIKKISDILINELGVEARENTFGKLPYPYTPQGLLSVWSIDPPAISNKIQLPPRMNWKQMELLMNNIQLNRS